VHELEGTPAACATAEPSCDRSKVFSVLAHDSDPGTRCPDCATNPHQDLESAHERSLSPDAQLPAAVPLTIRQPGLSYVIVRVLLKAGEVAAESALSITGGWPAGHVRTARNE
jgi:hypothetical protein